MDDAAAVRGAERAGDLDRVGDRLVDGQPAEPPDPVLERLALDVLEDDVGVAAVLAGPASVVASRWLAREDAALAGAFVAFELDDGVRATRHRVLRVPRCHACSPASGMPSLLPWASAVRR